MSYGRFKNYAIGVLVVVLAVILWGAYVRASSSGAGCGAHWPNCPDAFGSSEVRRATWIEFFHRGTSGISMLMVVALFIWSRRLPSARLHKATLAALILMCTEALIGAGLVLFEYVAQNASSSRAIWVAAHLTNTFLLLSALTASIVWARPEKPLLAYQASRHIRSVSLIGGIVLLLTGITGAITALGDTLFPAVTLSEGLAQDLMRDAHLYMRLRVFHPFMAMAAAAFILFAALWVLRQNNPTSPQRLLRLAAIATVSSQTAVGFLNIVWLTPIPLQMLHLLLADILWIVWTALALSPVYES